MKRKVLSILLSLCMVLTMVPAAFAEDNTNETGTNPSDLTENEVKSPTDEIPTEAKVFQVGENSYATLKEAVENIGQETMITLTGNFTGDSASIAGIPDNVTLVIKNGASLRLGLVDGITFMGTKGNVRIEAGGQFIFNDTMFVGSNGDSKINLSSGSVTVSDFNSSDSKFKLTVDKNSVAEVPANQELKLVILSGNGIDLTVDENAVLTVNGTLKPTGGASSANPSALAINGTLEMGEQGKLQMSFGTTVNVAATGTLILNDSGVQNGNGDTYNNSNKKFTFEEGSTVIVSENCAWDPSNFTTNTLKTYEDAEGNTVYANSSVENPEAAIGGTLYASLDGVGGALASAKSGDTIVLLNDAEISDATVGNTIGDGVTLDVPSGKTLTVNSSAIAMLTSQGKLVAHAGSTIKLPNSSGGEEVFIGNDMNARFKLTAGSISFDMGQKNLALTAGSVASIPSGKTTYLMLGTGENKIALNATIAKDAELTVSGTLKAVSGMGDTGTQLTVDGKLVIAENGMLTIADKASVTVNGTLGLPLLSKNDITGTGNGTGLLGDIVINGGAAVKYGDFQVTGDNALLTLESGAKATLNLANASLSLNSGKATVDGDNSGNMYSMLLLKEGGYLPLNITIDAEATAEVPTGKTLKIVKDSSMTINGTLDVKGILTIAQGVTGFAVGNGGTLNLPLMSKDAMTGTEDGTGLRGNISIASGAVISYATAPILGGEGAYLTLSEDGAAVVNVAESSLKLTAGTATVNGDSNGQLKALLVASDKPVVPLQIETAAGTTVDIPSGKTLSIPNGGKMAIGGALNVSGALEIHSTATLSGDVTVNGTVAVYGNSTDAEFNLAASGAKVLANGDIADKINSAASTRTPSSLSYNSIVSDVGEKTFTNGWEYYRPSSGGGGGSATTYAITVDSVDNGTVTASVKSASKGSTVTLTVKPDEGYQLDKLTVTDKDGKEISVTEKEDGKYTFTMPASKVSVSAAFTKSEEKPEQIAGFTDVLTTDWFADAVQYAVDNGMMNGTSETTFRPNGTTTRGMIVTILYRLEKEPAVDNGAGFADVAADQYYADAVAWASANDIVTGYSEEKFGPDDSITREQFAAILYRYAQYKKIDVTATADLSGYTDAAQISAYAETAMKWANGEGLITGVTDTMLKPAGNATRAQAATILMRFCEEVAK
jgi:hypothetical protein